MAHASEHWSEGLVEDTIRRLTDCGFPFHPEKGYFLKRRLPDENGTYEYGAVDVMDALQGDFKVCRADSSEIKSYKNTEELVADGWVLD